MYKLPDGNEEVYNKYITHLTKEEVLEGKHLEELNRAVKRRTFHMQLLLNGRQIQEKDLGGLEFEMDMGVDDWPIGQVTYKKMAFTVANDTYSIEGGLDTGQLVKPSIAIDVPDAAGKPTQAWVPYGQYIVDSVAKDVMLKNYSCYDQLYYLNDKDCEFEEEYSEETTVGFVLNKITSQYANQGIVPLTDSHKGDFEEWWDDVLCQPKKYKDYEAPPEEEEEEDEMLPEFEGDPLEDIFPEDAGQAPQINPGRCCDCGTTTGKPIDKPGDQPVQPEPPKFSEGLNIIVNSRCELFPDKTYSYSYSDVSDEELNGVERGHGYPIYATVSPFDNEGVGVVSPNILQHLRSGFRGDFCTYNKYIDLSWRSSDIDAIEISPEGNYGNRAARLIIKEPNAEVTITVTAKYNGKKPISKEEELPSEIANYSAKTSVVIRTPNVSEKLLLNDLWGITNPDDKPVATTLSDAVWDPTDVSGSFYSSFGCKVLYSQNGAYKNDSGTLKSFMFSSEGPNVAFENDSSSTEGYNHCQQQNSRTFEECNITIKPCEPFNTLYAVVEITKIHPSAKKYFRGISFNTDISSDGTLYYRTASGDKIKTNLNKNNSNVYYGYYAYSYYHGGHASSTVCAIPNYFIKKQGTMATNFAEDYSTTVCRVLFDLNLFQSEDPNLYKSVVKGEGNLFEYKIHYYGKRHLNSEEYKFFNENTRNDSNAAYYYADLYSYRDIDLVNNKNSFDRVFYHIGSCQHDNWCPEDKHWRLEAAEYSGNYDMVYGDRWIPTDQKGKVLKVKNSIWYTTSRLIKGGILKAINADGYFLDEEEEEDYDLSTASIASSTTPASYSLMNLPTQTETSAIYARTTLAAPSFDEDGNLIVTYNEVPDTDDPSQTPNDEGQVLVTEPEKVGYGMTEAQLLGYIAAYCGGNMVLDHDGELRLLRLVDPNLTTEDGKIGYDKHIPNNQVAMPEIDNCEASSTLGGLIIHTSTYEGDDIKLGNEKPSQTHYVLEIDNPFMTQERANKIFSEMTQLTYYPMRVVILSDPRVWLGDLLYFEQQSQYNDASKTNIEIVREGYYPVMKLISHYDGAPSLQIEANCSNLSDRTNTFTGSLTDKVDEVSAKVNEVDDAVKEFKFEMEELRALVGYINELFAIEVTADNIVTATVNTRNIRIAPTTKGNSGGLYIDGDSIDFIDAEGVQRLHLGTADGNSDDYFIRFLNANGYTRELRALDPGPSCCSGGGSGSGSGSGPGESSGQNLPTDPDLNVVTPIEAGPNPDFIDNPLPDTEDENGTGTPDDETNNGGLENPGTNPGTAPGKEEKPRIQIKVENGINNLSKGNPNNWHNRYSRKTGKGELVTVKFRLVDQPKNNVTIYALTTIVGDAIMVNGEKYASRSYQFTPDNYDSYQQLTFRTNDTFNSAELRFATLKNYYLFGDEKYATLEMGDINDNNNTEEPAEKLTLSQTSMTLEEFQYTTLTCSGASGTVSWSSTDTSVASVDSNGKVTANKTGNATIKCTTSNGGSATCSVTVTSTTSFFVAFNSEINVFSYVSGIDLDQFSQTAIHWTTPTQGINGGNLLSTLATITPQTTKFTSSNSSKVRVNDDNTMDVSGNPGESAYIYINLTFTLNSRTISAKVPIKVNIVDPWSTEGESAGGIEGANFDAFKIVTTNNVAALKKSDKGYYNRFIINVLPGDIAVKSYDSSYVTNIRITAASDDRSYISYDLTGKVGNTSIVFKSTYSNNYTVTHFIAVRNETSSDRGAITIS